MPSLQLQRQIQRVTQLVRVTRRLQHVPEIGRVAVVRLHRTRADRAGCFSADTGFPAQILNAVEPEFPVDLIVRTPQEVRRRLAQNDSFFGEITRRGRVLYDAARR